VFLGAKSNGEVKLEISNFIYIYFFLAIPLSTKFAAGVVFQSLLKIAMHPTFNGEMKYLMVLKFVLNKTC
jgi:hypothetical protein